MPKKLSLSTESLRVLADEQLAEVVGARRTGSKGKCKRSGRKRPPAPCPGR